MLRELSSPIRVYGDVEGIRPSQGRELWLTPVRLDVPQQGIETLRQAAFRHLEDLFLRGDEATASHLFETLRHHFPDLIREELLNTLGYVLLAKGDVMAAVAALRLNLEVFPNSSNAHHSLAEAYLESGDTLLAVHLLKRSLELEPGRSDCSQVLALLQS